MVRNFSLLVALFSCYLPSAFGAQKCMIFVHGHQSTSRTANDYNEVVKYWSGKKINKLGLEMGSEVGDGIAAATLNNYHYSYLVGYDATRSYIDASVDVAQQIDRAMKGLPDAGGSRFCPVNSPDMIYIVVAHSMGGVVMDFILGNSSPTNKNYNYNGAPFEQISKKIAYVMTIGSPHRGTSIANAVMGSTSFVPFNLMTSFFALQDEGTRWLQTSDSFQVSRFMSHPSREIRLFAGRKTMGPSLFLRGDDDGIVSFASAFACSGDPTTSRRANPIIPFYDKGVCNNTDHMGGFVNFSNYNWSEENHSNQRRDLNQRDRNKKGLPGGKVCSPIGSFMREVGCSAGK